MVGQDAVNVATTFDSELGIDSVLMSKLDGDARGGAALSVKAVTGKPIKFCGVGEKLDNLEVFHPERMASRILGMGDMLSLIEEATVKMDQKKAEETARRLQQNKFDLTDLLAQFQQVKQMGSMKSLLSKIPGMEKQLRDADIDDRVVDRMEAIILSMTPQERAKPDLLNASRKRRIAAGSGMRVEDVNRLLKQYEQMQKMMKQMKNNKRFRGGGMGGFGGLKGLGL
jgi:signal recognition particle subunit SRP54